MDKLLNEYHYHLSFRKKFSVKEKAVITRGFDGAYNEGIDTAFDVMKFILKELDRTGNFPNK